MKTKLFAALCAALCALTFCACKPADPYKDYLASSIEAAPMPLGSAHEVAFSFGSNRAELFCDYQSFAAEKLPLNYTEGYFENNDLLVFATHCCSSDEMEFGEVLENEGKLYPVFYRDYIPDGAAVTEDFIVLIYYAEVPKSAGYTLGEVIFRYR